MVSKCFFNDIYQKLLKCSSGKLQYTGMQNRVFDTKYTVVQNAAKMYRIIFITLLQQFPLIFTILNKQFVIYIICYSQIYLFHYYKTQKIHDKNKHENIRIPTYSVMKYKSNYASLPSM